MGNDSSVLFSNVIFFRFELFEYLEKFDRNFRGNFPY